MDSSTNTDQIPDKNRRKVLPDDMGLATMLILVVVVSLLLVAISYALYATSPQSKYDLARPGQPTDSVVTDIDDQDLDTSEYVDANVAKEKIESLEQEIRALSGYNKFESSDLDDQNIGLQSSDQLSQ